jgi:tetratricopeptide (TPR) repeat protein
MERSKSFAREAVELYRESGDVERVAGYLSKLAEKTIWEGNFSTHIAGWLEEAQIIYAQLGDKSGKATTLDLFGRMAFWQANYEQAYIFIEKSAALHEETGSSLSASWSRANLAYIILRRGEVIQAQSLFKKVIRHFQEINNVIGIVFVIEGFASLNVNQNQPALAARLFAWTDAMRNKIGDHRPPVEQGSVDKDLEVIKSQLTEKEFAESSKKGRTMTTEQAIALALES